MIYYLCLYHCLSSQQEMGTKSRFRWYDDPNDLLAIVPPHIEAVNGPYALPWLLLPFIISTTTWCLLSLSLVYIKSVSLVYICAFWKVFQNCCTSLLWKLLPLNHAFMLCIPSKIEPTVVKISTTFKMWAILCPEVKYLCTLKSTDETSVYL